MNFETAPLYILFILITKTNLYLFYLIMIFLGISYIINIIKEQKEEEQKEDEQKKLKQKNLEQEKIEHEQIGHEKTEYEQEEKEKKEELKNIEINNYDIIVYILYIITFFTIFIGVLIYMGEKKLEYKNNFNYFTFFIGKSNCKGKSPNLNFIKSLQSHFKY